MQATLDISFICLYSQYYKLQGEKEVQIEGRIVYGVSLPVSAIVGVSKFNV